MTYTKLLSKWAMSINNRYLYSIEHEYICVRLIFTEILVDYSWNVDGVKENPNKTGIIIIIFTNIV